MKYLKTFESYHINETLGDLMTLPVDPIPGTLDVFNDIKDAIKKRYDEFMKSLSKVPMIEVQKIKAFLMKNFGTTTPELSKENLQKCVQLLGLDLIQTTVAEGFKENESLFIMLCGRVKQLLGLNMHAWGGLAGSILIAVLTGTGFGGFVVATILSYILMYIFIAIMQLFGYGDDRTDVHLIGEYDPSRDIRTKY